MAKKLLFFILFTFGFSTSYASHNRAGEIVYRHISGLTYEITIYTYTIPPGSADTPILDVSWGDNTVQSVQRDKVIAINSGTQANVYKAIHTYSGPGKFIISFSDRNRNNGVLNMDDSFNTAVYVESAIIINPFINSPLGGNNNSVQLLYPPLDEACVDEIFFHNPLAFDPDGDSLVYSLIPSRGINGETIPSYVFPDKIGAGPENVITIDSQTGELIWNEPKEEGEYNVAMQIDEYRDGILMGYVVRDMQINVRSCTNRAPEFLGSNDTCIEAGSTLLLAIKATDPDSNNVSLSAFGYPLEKTSNTATFNQPNATIGIGNFQWSTTCDDIRKERHQVLFRADDGANPERLIALKTYNITVVGPAPKNPAASPVNNNIQLSWTKNNCSNAIGYYIYRRIDSIGFTPDNCELGVPEYTGYKLVATIEDINDTSLLDVNVYFGNQYCYMVTAFYPDGAESYASVEFCAIRSRIDIPVITKASIGVTSATIGEDTIKWFPPIQLDTLVGFTGPYQYQVEVWDTTSNSFTTVFTSTSNASLTALSTSYVHKNLNTVDYRYQYKVSVLNNGIKVGASDNASTIFLTSYATDNSVKLRWIEQTPWENDTFYVYQKRDVGSFQLIGKTSDTNFVATGLANEINYCFVIVAHGRYAALSNEPILNSSQQVCATPIDNVFPCAVPLTIDGSCELEQNSLTWQNGTLSCSGTDDVLFYNVYYSSLRSISPNTLLTTLAGASNISYTHVQENNIAGCYAITTIDSVGNESAKSNVVCIDNCPEYKLPNVFTPNGDGMNDTFKPVSSKYITDVVFTVFNRWGDVVFTTTDPDIGWDGKHSKTNKVVADGVYQYMVEVNKKTIDGIVAEKINGYLTLKSGGGNN
ncbi:MAG: gliding motility-associated-like protein [Flavobacteriales bacterium]|jgi:gliding motility-associated-like protein